jgi:hypothetical protein
MTGAIEQGWPKAKSKQKLAIVSKVSKSKQILLTLLYFSLRTQSRSPFPAEVMKTANDERFYIN